MWPPRWQDPTISRRSWLQTTISYRHPTSWCERGPAVRPCTWECCCVALSCGYVPVCVDPRGLVVPLSLTAR
jgi:hypothetical protein